MDSYHVPVFRKEAVDLLNPEKGKVMVDATMGGGGHTLEILNRLEGGTVLAFDRDKVTKANVLQDERLIFVHADFRYLKRYLRLHKIQKVDGILADLGISSNQIDKGDYGMSIRHEGPLDMRMDNRESLTAAEILNTYRQDEIAAIFWNYGELRNARKLAEVIVKERKQVAFRKTTDLIRVAEPLLKGKRIREMAQVFQALRIEVNGELDALKALLEQSVEVLKPGGRLVIISYHSLEDRITKNFMKTGNIEGKLEKDIYGNSSVPFRLITRKVIVPSFEDVQANSRARSARMRCAERIEE